MTAQVGELLIYQGRKRIMHSEPLNVYLEKHTEFRFGMESTANYRGYFGTWEIEDDLLYLINLKGRTDEGKSVNMNYLFPGKEKVKATWFSGELNLPKGKPTGLFFTGYSDMKTHTEVLIIENGKLVNTYLKENPTMNDLDLR